MLGIFCSKKQELKKKIEKKDKILVEVDKEIDSIKTQFKIKENKSSETIEALNNKIDHLAREISNKDRFIEGLQIEIKNINTNMEQIKEENKKKLENAAYCTAQIKQKLDTCSINVYFIYVSSMKKRSSSWLRKQ